MALPPLTTEQRAAALVKAAEARKVRAEFKRQVSSGEISPQQALEQALEHDTLRKTRVFDFLRALPSIGAIKAKQHMQALDIAETRRLRGIGSRQLEELVKLCVDIETARLTKSLA